jgi:hypothetical protein
VVGAFAYGLFMRPEYGVVMMGHGKVVTVLESFWIWVVSCPEFGLFWYWV